MYRLEWIDWGEDKMPRGRVVDDEWWRTAADDYCDYDEDVLSETGLASVAMDLHHGRRRRRLRLRRRLPRGGGAATTTTTLLLLLFGGVSVDRLLRPGENDRVADALSTSPRRRLQPSSTSFSSSFSRPRHGSAKWGGRRRRRTSTTTTTSTTALSDAGYRSPSSPPPPGNGDWTDGWGGGRGSSSSSSSSSSPRPPSSAPTSASAISASFADGGGGGGGAADGVDDGTFRGIFRSGSFSIGGGGAGSSAFYEDPEIDGSVVANGSTGWGLYAPEVNKWTTLMADGTNAAIHRPGREMTLEEGMEILYNDLKDLSAEDYVNIETYWDRLVPTLAYLGRDARRQVKQALCVAYRAHRSQVRKSGEPYIIHPVEVGLLLSGMKMDASTVMSGLLHDTVEDTDLTFEQVEAMFGLEVRNIVEGETKVSKLPKLAFADYADEQAENLRQMFIAMTDDYRIIIVKLADRLHNMRTLSHMKPEKQKKISRETLDIFAPLAHRMGLWPFKSELEDTAFMYLYPKEYEELNRRLGQRQRQFGETLDNSIVVLERTLTADPTLRSQDVGIEVVGRTKELYSLWHKMEMKRDRNLDHITDLVALRVILTPGGGVGGGGARADPGEAADGGVWLCYHVLGLVQHLPGFQPMPTKVKDYISFPKPNGYQSLHTALMCNGQSVEVQIRTSSMHQVAEFGMASHFAYKDTMKRGNAAGGSSSSSSSSYNTPWLSSIKEWQQDTLCSRDFVDSVRRELLGKRVFVFLRNGKILNLSRGATVVGACVVLSLSPPFPIPSASFHTKSRFDYFITRPTLFILNPCDSFSLSILPDAAFQIHTTVGLQMHGVEINGKPVRVSSSPPPPPFS